MKKMQCEVCGSNEIKKVADGIFECQSCGVQYSVNDVKKLLVEIDHTNEAQNYIKRGEQFEKSGESEKAKEYYNKALDIDVENESAQEGLDRVLEQQSWNDYYIIEADVDPKENIKDFLKQLATTKNIACDIYKHIKIDSVIEKYTTAVFIKQKCEYNWSATACNRYYENQTVYKEKYNSDLKRYVKEPVTEKVEKISRTPVNGREIYDNDGFALTSNTVNNECQSKAELLSDLIQDFETLQDNKYADYNVRNIDKTKLHQESGCYRYGEIQLDIDFDRSVCKAKQREILDSGDRKASNIIQNHIDADFVENYHCIRSVLSDSVACIFIPVQIINYTYKGIKYSAISDLLSKTSSIPYIYPCDVQLSENKKELLTDNAKSQKLSGLFITGIIGFVIGAIFLFIAANSYDGDVMGFSAIALWLISLVLMFAGLAVKRSEKNKFEQKSKELKDELLKPRTVALSNSFKEFFDLYDRDCSVEDCQNAITSEVVDIENVVAAIAFAGDIDHFDPEATVKLSAEEIEINRIENEIEELKKKRILPIILMTVFGILIIPLFVGTIMLGNVNAKINKLRAELAPLKHGWIEQ